MTSLKAIALRCCVAAAALVLVPQASGQRGAPVGASTARYEAIRADIRKNLHRGPHFTRAVTVRTIGSVRQRVSMDDAEVLVSMLADKDYAVASAASGLLVTLGEPAVPALQGAASSGNAAVALQARDALALLARCREQPQSVQPAACPQH